MGVIILSEKQLCIISNGKEISYGLNLYHLFQYKDEKESFRSSRYASIKVDMYSTAAFKHANVSKKGWKIFISDVSGQLTSTSKEIIFEKYGMILFRSNESLFLEVKPKELTGNGYTEFLAYANRCRKEYIEIENDYVEKVKVKAAHWIADTFNPIEKKGLFCAKNTDAGKRQQQYDCLAFIIYLDYVEKLIE